MTRRSLYRLTTLVAASLLLGFGQLLAQEAEAASSPGLTDEEMEQFLLNAKVLRCRTTPVGITQPLRCTLSDGTLTHDAGFQKVNIKKVEK